MPPRQLSGPGLRAAVASLLTLHLHVHATQCLPNSGALLGSVNEATMLNPSPRFCVPEIPDRALLLPDLQSRRMYRWWCRRLLSQSGKLCNSQPQTYSRLRCARYQTLMVPHTTSAAQGCSHRCSTSYSTPFNRREILPPCRAHESLCSGLLTMLWRFSSPTLSQAF